MRLEPGLGYAVLDDVSVVRRSLFRFLGAQFSASPERSFAAGQTWEEARRFVGDVMRLRPDLVIVDQHLEYPEDEGAGAELRRMLGTDVARELRAAGFSGAVVLHSANTLLQDSFEGAPGRARGDAAGDAAAASIDGFMEKRALSRTYIEGVLSAALARRRG